jgi:hypothetical protein
MKELGGKRALVTGGTKGIGKAVVAWLRAAGPTCLRLRAREPARASSPPDIATAEGCARVAKAAGSVDMLVHVAGGSSAPAGGFPSSTTKRGRDKRTANPQSPARRLARPDEIVALNSSARVQKEFFTLGWKPARPRLCRRTWRLRAKSERVWRVADSMRPA